MTQRGTPQTKLPHTPRLPVFQHSTRTKAFEWSIEYNFPGSDESEQYEHNLRSGERFYVPLRSGTNAKRQTSKSPSALSLAKELPPGHGAWIGKTSSSVRFPEAVSFGEVQSIGPESDWLSAAVEEIQEIAAENNILNIVARAEVFIRLLSENLRVRPSILYDEGGVGFELENQELEAIALFVLESNGEISGYYDIGPVRGRFKTNDDQNFMETAGWMILSQMNILRKNFSLYRIARE